MRGEEGVELLQFPQKSPSSQNPLPRGAAATSLLLMVMM